MTAKRPTKSQRAAKRRSKERAAAKHKREPLTPIDIWAAGLVEAYEALCRAGMNQDQARWYIESTMGLPEWIHKNPDHTPYEYDDDDEDE